MSKQDWIEENLQPGEQYAGIILRNNGPDYHLVVLPDECKATWGESTAWAKSKGGSLPNRKEQSLLFANLGHEFYPNTYWASNRRADIQAEEDLVSTVTSIPARSSGGELPQTSTYVAQIPESPRPLTFLNKIKLIVESLVLGTLFIGSREKRAKALRRGSLSGYAGEASEASVELQRDQAWMQDFMTGAQSHASVSTLHRARAVRRILIEDAKRTAKPVEQPAAEIRSEDDLTVEENQGLSAAQKATGKAKPAKGQKKPKSQPQKVRFDMPMISQDLKAQKQGKATDAAEAEKQQKKSQPPRRNRAAAAYAEQMNQTDQPTDGSAQVGVTEDIQESAALRAAQVLKEVRVSTKNRSLQPIFIPQIAVEPTERRSAANAD